MSPVRLGCVSEMARQLAERLLAALRRVELLYPSDLSATGDVPEAPGAPRASQPDKED